MDAESEGGGRGGGGGAAAVMELPFFPCCGVHSTQFGGVRGGDGKERVAGVARRLYLS